MKTVQEHKNGQCTMNNVQWRKMKLGNCCAVNPKTDTTKVLDDDVVALVRMEDVSNDGFITSFSERTYKSLQKRGLTIFQNEDVIFAKITPCMENGKGALVRNMKSKICMGSTEFHVLRACDNVSIDFIYQLTISKRFRQRAEMQMTGSAGQQRVPTAFLEDCLISIPFKNNKPDLSAQRRIAAILTSADKVIAATQKTIAKYKQIKQGMMEELLNEQCTMNNGKWARKTLIELADYYNGMAFKPSDWENDGTKIIRIEQLNNPLGKYDYYKGCFSETNAIHNGDLIFSWSATLKVVIWQWGDGVLNQHLFKVVPASNVDKHFLYYLLDYNMPKLGESSHGSTMKHIKRKELETYTAYIPRKIAEQKRIASILSSIDSKIECEQSILNKHIQVKKGLMDKLLNE